VAIALRGLEFEAQQAEAMRKKWAEEHGEQHEFEASEVERQVSF